ncbi:MAG: PASTA domain-containing protein [Nitrospiraceae bacterium]|nr:MAG: PASTA domain-containing protein [Nitrospiraceae bacterium]
MYISKEMIKTLSKLVLYFVSFVALGAAAAYLFFQIRGFEDMREVPALVGLDLSEATELLNREKLTVTIEEEMYSVDTESGHILKQSVEEGKRVRAGTGIGVIVSKGSEMYSMPSFEGHLLEDAKLTISNLGMKLGKITMVQSDTVEKGKIIAQRPLPGNIQSNEINFLVSKGHYDVSYKCPSFVNMNIDDARILAKELGIILVEKDKGSRVIFQKPEAERIIQKGDSVEVTLGRGWGMWF